MSNSSRNYHAHGGNEWVIGGKLTFLPGASVEGVDGLFDEIETATMSPLPCVPLSEATTVAALRESFNQLIKAMQAAGFMADSDNTAPVE